MRLESSDSPTSSPRAPLSAHVPLIAVAWLLGAVLWLLGAAPAAAASATAYSANWSGYAVHRRGVSFRQVSGTWRVPTASCRAGQPAYSATWVGIGGYSLNSKALEQIGTETDCTAAGQVATAAWYELVPAPSRTARLVVHAGDLISASVAISGHRVTLTLTDRSTGRRFARTLKASTLDLGSAEWIEEAPSECTGEGNCQILPLADFGMVDFSAALTRDRSGHRGPITDPSWDRTRILLSASGRYYAAYETGPIAVPSALKQGGSAFAVSYQGASGSGPARQAAVRLARDNALRPQSAGSLRTPDAERVDPGGRRAPVGGRS